MTQSVKASEPAMEEILASIRRIIAEDDTTKSAQPEPEVSRIAAPVPNPAASSAPRAPLPPPAATHSTEQPPVAAARGLFGEQSAATLEPAEATGASSPQAGLSAASRVAPGAQCHTTDGVSDVGFANAAETSAARRRADQAQLLSPETSAAVDAALNTLAQSVLVRSARTLEDLVREMLRPMLKNWLDANLPSLVERLVRAEIERVSRGH